MDTWKVGDIELKSRLILGSGKFRDFGVMREAIKAAGAEVVTVAIRRVEARMPGHVGLLETLEGVRLLPNTAGARTAEEALRIARLGRVLTGERWVKLEVIPDPTYLLPFHREPGRTRTPGPPRPPFPPRTGPPPGCR